MGFSENLQNLRKIKNMSQEQLAKNLMYQDKQCQNGKVEMIIQKLKK